MPRYDNMLPEGSQEMSMGKEVVLETETNRRKEHRSAPPIKNEEEELQDSLAFSSALVGETIVDSPQLTRTILHNYEDVSDNSLLTSPDLYNRAVRAPQHLPPPRPRTTDDTDAMSVGIMAQGLDWVRRQRECRKRMYLQNQAEQQLLKLRLAREAQNESGRSLVDNPTFQNFTANLNRTSIDRRTADPSPDEDKDDFDASTTISKSGDGISVALASYGQMDDEELDASFIPPVRVVDEQEELKSNPFLLTRPQMHQIASHVLPRGIAYCRWKRLYTLARDGDAFDACLRCIQDHPQTLLVVRTSRNAVMGAFVDAAWEPHTQNGACYYGGSSACLFKIDAKSGKVKYFKWTGANHYVQLCDASNKMIAFGGGGGGGSFGLCLQDDFQVGSTGHCATFDNEPLCAQENFSIVDMEVFGFLVGQF
jgi:hypothetical protein